MEALREPMTSVILAITIALPLYYGNGLFYGLHGQIQPSTYPAGWYAADQALSQDPHPGKSVFLPWHGYMSYAFVHNTNRVIASPAPLFFSVPVVASQDLELPDVRPPGDPDQLAISSLVASGQLADWAGVLAQLHFKYVLVAREVDWETYRYLDSQSGLVLVGDYGTILMYRNTAWRGG
jgi:hypothetical protein